MGVENATKNLGKMASEISWGLESQEKVKNNDGNVQLWVFYTEQNIVMFCSILIGSGWPRKFGQVNETTGYM